jgi:hypothetical protein
VRSAMSLVICSSALLGIALVCWSVPRLTIAANSSAQSNEGAPLIAGEYLVDSYIAKLKKGFSAYRADDDRIPQLVVVHIDGSKTIFGPIFNFHEGGAEFSLDSNGNTGIIEGQSYDASNLSITVLSSQHFSLHFDKYGPLTYTFVGDASRYVGRALLSGKYADALGQSYIFDASGTATFPGGRKFEYLAGIDHVLNQFDYFVDKSTKRTYAFKRTDKTLDVFETSGDFSQNIASKPLLVLKKVEAEH